MIDYSFLLPAKWYECEGLNGKKFFLATKRVQRRIKQAKEDRGDKQLNRIEAQNMKSIPLWLWAPSVGPQSVEEIQGATFHTTKHQKYALALVKRGEEDFMDKVIQEYLPEEPAPVKARETKPAKQEDEGNASNASTPNQTRKYTGEELEGMELEDLRSLATQLGIARPARRRAPSLIEYILQTTNEQ